MNIEKEEYIHHINLKLNNKNFIFKKKNFFIELLFNYGISLPLYAGLMIVSGKSFGLSNMLILLATSILVVYFLKFRPYRNKKELNEKKLIQESFPFTYKDMKKIFEQNLKENNKVIKEFFEEILIEDKKNKMPSINKEVNELLSLKLEKIKGK